MGFLRKLAGLFVERVPVDEQGRPVKPVPGPRGVAAPPPSGIAASTPTQASYPGHPGHQPVQGGQPTVQQGGFPMNGLPMVAGATTPAQPMPASTPGAPASQQPGPYPQQPAGPTVAVALRAIVPQEYAAHLAPHGLHVIAAGPDITSEQARGWGAQVLVVSAECLGQDLHLLQRPQLATVYIAPQAVMLPAHPGVVQVQEPLHASDVAHAVREAAAGWAATAPPTHG